MLLHIFVSVFSFPVDGHIIFTECQAEYFRSQPGNQDVVFETDGRRCQTEARVLTKKRKQRGLLSEDYWDNFLQNSSLTDWLAGSMRWKNILQNGSFL